MGTDTLLSETSADRDTNSGEDIGTDEAAAKAEYPVHRLRDLDRRGRLAAAVLALALIVSPVVAFVQFAPDWAPANDPAVMAFRAFDVGTHRTPLIGQPSTASSYVGAEPVGEVSHLGPVHFYLLAPAVRLFGAAPGMLLVSVLLNSTCLLVLAWVTFRQLGPRAGLIAALLLSAITFTTGAASLIQPLNSMVAAYPLLVSVVLAWCLLCRDVRLLPLAIGFASFTAQQHLSVLPTLCAALGVGLVGLVVQLRDQRRELLRWTGIAAIVGLVLWSAPLIQQLTGSPGNLSQAVRFAGDDRVTVGKRAALRQLAHVLGLPPLLGKTDFDGWWLFNRVSPLTWVSATAVLVALGVLAVYWRRDRPRRALVVVMVAVLVPAGLVNGAAVPAGLGTGRVDFYHWVWPLTFLVTLCLALAVTDLVPRRFPWGMAIPVVVLAVAMPPLINPSLERLSNQQGAASSPVERRYLEDLADQVYAQRGRLEDQTVLYVRDQLNTLNGLDAALAVELEERGLSLQFNRALTRGFHEDRVADEDQLRMGLVLVVETAATTEEEPAPGSVPPEDGEVIAEVSTRQGFDIDAYETLVETIQRSPRVVPGQEQARALADASADARTLYEADLQNLHDHPGRALLDQTRVRHLLDQPLAEPRLDPDLLERLDDSMFAAPAVARMRVYLLDHDQVIAFVSRWELTGEF